MGDGREVAGRGAELKRDSERVTPLTVEQMTEASGSAAIAEMLLSVAKERLARAVALERRCGLPLSETSVIAHDIAKLVRRVEQPLASNDLNDPDDGDGFGTGDDDL